MLVSTRLRNARLLPDAELQEQVKISYAQVLAAAQSAGRQPVRFWNHVPGINITASDQRDRYMVFNAGRYEACVHAYGNASTFDNHIATATGVGCAGADLVIHCLAADAPGMPINNPRQVAPYHYSQRFGPLPPCFARAMRINPRLLLVGGTAAVRGEDSVYREDLVRQVRETFTNLAAVVSSARGLKFFSRAAASHRACYRELRAYLPNIEHQPRVGRMIQENFPNLRRVEFLAADLCRPELLVEIEGIAELS